MRPNIPLLAALLFVSGNAFALCPDGTPEPCQSPFAKRRLDTLSPSTVNPEEGDGAKTETTCKTAECLAASGQSPAVNTGGAKVKGKTALGGGYTEAELAKLAAQGRAQGVADQTTVNAQEVMRGAESTIPTDTPNVLARSGPNVGNDENWTTQDSVAIGEQAAKLSDSGHREQAGALIRAALEKHPDDKTLQSYAALEKKRETTLSDKSLKERANELLATLRGDAGEAPPGAGLTASPFGNPAGKQSPALASALAFPTLGAAAPSAQRALTPAALAEMGRQDSGIRLANPLVRDAISKFMVRDLPAAEALLTQRLEQNPSDERALKFRALTRRQMGKFEPSAHDATSALTLEPWDAQARRVLIDDEVDLGHAQQALEEANAGLQATPNSADILAARANAYASLGMRELQLADLKEAAALDAKFEDLYQQALAGPAAPAKSRRPHSTLVWLGAVGTALIFFSFVLFRKRGDSSVRLAMREEDHALLARGARPDAAPAGFKIVKTLGQGGMGVVYEAVDMGLQRTVALKKLRAEIADSPRERARFLKEARTVAALKHPNIVEIHAIHEDAEGLFLVFEKVQGETLHERLGRGPLPPAEAVAYLRQVAKALDCAHASGVVHQDLKPANIMVAGETAKVMDFGIARRVQETLSTLSRIEVAGTPAYMAPEQERGGAAVGPAADIFALGACSYELLTGRTPFPNGGMMMKAEKMYRPASQVVSGIPAAADQAIGRALEPEPGARWPSATSFVEALARSLS